MYKSQIYQDVSGERPFSDWLNLLKKKDRMAAAKIDTRIDRAETGNFGDHKPVREGVWELRIDYGPGYRAYYAIENGKIILLLIGGTKKTQDADIDRAIAYLQDYRQRVAK